jgi:hypothetical protein
MRRREDKIFWSEWELAIPECNLLLIYSWLQFWFVTVPKYLNFATFKEFISAVIKYRRYLSSAVK